MGDGCAVARILAVRRGEKEGFLTVHIRPPEAMSLLDCCKEWVGCLSQFRPLLRDSLWKAPRHHHRLRRKSSTKSELRAAREAIRIFSDNLRHLLMEPPLGFEKGHDELHTGCKLVCLVESSSRDDLPHSEWRQPLRPIHLMGPHTTLRSSTPRRLLQPGRPRKLAQKTGQVRPDGYEEAEAQPGSVARRKRSEVHPQHNRWIPTEEPVETLGEVMPC